MDSFDHYDAGLEGAAEPEGYAPPPLAGESSRAPDMVSSREDDADGPQEPNKKRVKRKPRVTDPGDGRQPGTSVFPTARVQKILKVDEDMSRMSREAVFLTSIAAEHFVKRLASQGWLRARLAQKKVLTLDHLASVVKQEDEFNFLQDIIPQTVPLSVALAGRQAKENANPNLPTYNPQTVQELIPPATLHESTHPDHPGALAKNERGTHHRKVGINPVTGLAEGRGTTATAAALASGGGGGAQSKRRSSSGKAVSPEASKAVRSSRRRSIARETAEAETEQAEATGNGDDAGQEANEAGGSTAQADDDDGDEDEDVEMQD